MILARKHFDISVFSKPPSGQAGFSLRHENPTFIATVLDRKRPIGSGARRVIRNNPFILANSDPWLKLIISHEEPKGDPLRQDEVAAALGFIKHTFSLNVSELAGALRVSRPTVYTWAEGGRAEEPHRQRMAILRMLAETWEALCSEPLGTHVHEPCGNGASIIDRLNTLELPVAAIKEAFKTCAAAIENRRGEQPSRGASFRELARRHGLEQVSGDKYRLNVRTATRGRHG